MCIYSCNTCKKWANIVKHWCSPDIGHNVNKLKVKYRLCLSSANTDVVGWFLSHTSSPGNIILVQIRHYWHELKSVATWKTQYKLYSLLLTMVSNIQSMHDLYYISQSMQKHWHGSSTLHLHAHTHACTHTKACTQFKKSLRYINQCFTKRSSKRLFFCPVSCCVCDFSAHSRV